MVKPELVLSNTATFFSGNIEAIFKKARAAGFKLLELLPYRWNTPEQIYNLSREYELGIAGIHLPPSWDKEKTSMFNKLWDFYLGGAKTSPGLQLAQILNEDKQNPYVLLHADLADKIPPAEMAALQRDFRLGIENVPENALESPIMIFDPSHYLRSPHRHPETDIAEIYRQLQPETVHISFDYPPQLHTLPRVEEQKALARMLKAHRPRYIVIETNPAVNVRKAKRLLSDIIASVG